MILITGCNGLIGSAIARKALQEGKQIRGLKRPNSDMKLLADIANKIEWVAGDVLDVFSLKEALEGVDAVIHTAAVVSFAPKDVAKMYKVNIEGTANVVNECLMAGTKKMLFVSSVAALGRPALPKGKGQTTTYIDENQKWEESSFNSHYAKTKYQAELEVWRGVAEGLDAIVVNPSMVLGEGDWDKSSTRLFKYVFDQKKYFTNGLVNYIDVQDVANICLQLMDSDVINERFVLSSGHTTYQQLFEAIAQSFGVKPPSQQVSPWLAEIIWRIEAIRSWFSGNAPLLTRETARTARSAYIYDNAKIMKQLNYQFQSLESTTDRVCAYLERK